MIELFQQPFVQNAFLAGTLIAVVAGVIGYFVVLRSQAFAAHALSHVGFAGATGAAFLGMSSLVGMFAFTILAALGMGSLEKRIQGRDVEIGMVLSFVLGLGVLFLRLYTNSASEAVGVLFGSIWSVSTFDLVLTLVSGAVILVALAVIFRPLLFVSIDPGVAEARGVPVKFISVFFMLLVAMTVAEAVLMVGILLVFALIVVPAASAQHMTRKPFSVIALSVTLALFFTWGGLSLSIFTGFPPSFYIAALAAVSYFLIVTLSHFNSPHPAETLMHPHHEV